MEPKYKVLFHLPDSTPERQEQVLRNVENLLNDFPVGEVEVEVIAHAGGISAFSADASTTADKIEGLSTRGVCFSACSNAVRNAGLTSESLLPNVRIVSSGIGEIVRKQAEGWIYLRP